MAPKTKKAAPAPVAPASAAASDNSSSQHDVMMNDAPASSIEAGAGQEGGVVDDDIPILDRQVIRIVRAFFHYFTVLLYPANSQNAAAWLV